MKYSLFFIFLCFLNACAQEVQKLENTVAITYTALTRGSSFKCVLSNNSVTVLSSNDDVKKKTINQEEWITIANLVDAIALADMHTFIALTENQAVDRARMANLSIIFNGKLYESVAFDEGSPPKELKPLITHIRALAETVE